MRGGMKAGGSPPGRGTARGKAGESAQRGVGLEDCLE